MEDKIQAKTSGLTRLVLIGAVVAAAWAVGIAGRTWQTWQELQAAEPLTVEDSNAYKPRLEKALAADKEVAEALKKNNLIVPPPQEQNPIRECAGIAFGEALVNGDWREVGYKAGEAKIIAIESTYIVVEWKGKETRLHPFDAEGGGSGGSDGPGPRGSGPKRSRGGRPSSGPPPGGPMPEISPEEQREIMMKMKDMSPEERQAFAEQMQERMGR